MRTKTRRLVSPGVVLTAALLAAPLAAQPLPSPRADLGGGIVRVMVTEDGPALERLRDGSRLWRRSLPAVPGFLQAGPSGQAVAGSIVFDRPSASWAMVFDSKGASWLVPGVPRRVHLSSDGRRVLVLTSSDGKGSARVYDVEGDLVAELPSEVGEVVSVELSRAGDAVLIAPGGEEPAIRVSLYDLSAASLSSIEMPGEESAEFAVAVDAHHVVTLGGGTLRWHDLETEGASWGRHPAGGYSSLLGVSDDGRRILVSLRDGSYHLVDDHGEVVWILDPTDPPREVRSALAAVDDLRRLQVELLAGGDVLLRHRSSAARYVVRAPGTADAEIRPIPPAALIDPAGGIVDASD